MPVVTRVSQATRPVGSARRTSSKTASEIWSATLSGWPSVTDSDVNRWESRWLMVTPLAEKVLDPYRLDMNIVGVYRSSAVTWMVDTVVTDIVRRSHVLTCY